VSRLLLVVRHAQAETVLLGSALYVGGKLCHGNITVAEHEYTTLSRNVTAEAAWWYAGAIANVRGSRLDNAT
jgi:hypothetical protein